MTLRNLLPQKLAEAATSQQPGNAITCRDEQSAWTVTVTADRVDEIGSVLREVRMRHGGPGGLRMDADVSVWANRISSSVGGLLETLKVVEVDVVRNEAILRSEKPH